jgi:predicted nucleic acid-binding protein
VTLVDSNVLIDLFMDDPAWSGWSIARLREAVARGPLIINDVVYAETSTRFERIEHFDTELNIVGIKVAPLPPNALFLAGKVFVQYRRAGGTRSGVLPDFFIGAQATVERIPLLTRDAKRYRHYFPALELIGPE